MIANKTIIILSLSIDSSLHAVNNFFFNHHIFDSSFTVIINLLLAN